MASGVLVVVFGLLAVIAGFAIRRDLKTGISGDGLYRFRADSNPLGFGAIIAGKGFVLCLGAAEILHVLGLGEDPMALLRRIFG